jgi:hypothetical protein
VTRGPGRTQMTVLHILATDKGRDDQGWLVVTSIEDAIADIMGDLKFPAWDPVRGLEARGYVEVEQIPFALVKEAGGLMRRGMRYSRARVTPAGRDVYDELKYELQKPADWDEREEKKREPSDPEREEMWRRMQGAMGQGRFRAFWKYRTLLHDLRKRGAITGEQIRYAEEKVLRTRGGAYNVRQFQRHVIALAKTAIKEHPELFKYGYGESGNGIVTRRNNKP